MIERHITFTVEPRHRRASSSASSPSATGRRWPPRPGYVRVELLREAEDATRYQMVLRFQDLDASVGWRTSPVHQGLQPDLNALVSSSVVQAYEVIA